MKKVLYLEKKVGETPLETIERFKEENQEYKEEKMTYAGRLDPMAKGVLIVLVGFECKNKERYLGMDKEYEFEILWGFETDTYDILGLPQVSSHFSYGKEELKKSLEKLKGKQKQKYPPYSSMTVEGKQLFQWAREGRLGEIDIPDQVIEIYDIELLSEQKITKEELRKNITDRINLVKGDFRQEEILTNWNTILNSLDREEFEILKLKTKCSSGTYVRGIVNDLGKKLKTGAIAYSINRTKIYRK